VEGGVETTRFTTRAVKVNEINLYTVFNKKTWQSTYVNNFIKS